MNKEIPSGTGKVMELFVFWVFLEWRGCMIFFQDERETILDKNRNDTLKIAEKT